MDRNARFLPSLVNSCSFYAQKSACGRSRSAIQIPLQFCWMAAVGAKTREVNRAEAATRNRRGAAVAHAHGELRACAVRANSRARARFDRTRPARAGDAPAAGSCARPTTGRQSDHRRQSLSRVGRQRSDGRTAWRRKFHPRFRQSFGSQRFAGHHGSPLVGGAAVRACESARRHSIYLELSGGG